MGGFQCIFLISLSYTICNTDEYFQLFRQRLSKYCSIYQTMSFLQIKQVGLVQCNATAFCPDGQTCCRLASGQWGCCPFPNAVCCSDGQHCCQSGYTCSATACTKGDETVPYLTKMPVVSALLRIYYSQAAMEITSIVVIVLPICDIIPTFFLDYCKRAGGLAKLIYILIKRPLRTYKK